eukprot:scaffold55888_cov35-Attheya_sp.AAC.2
MAFGHAAPIRSSDKVLAGQEQEKKRTGYGLIGKEVKTFAKRLAGLLSTSIFTSLWICKCEIKYCTCPSNQPLPERFKSHSTTH